MSSIFALDDTNVYDINRMALLCLMHDKANGRANNPKQTIQSHIKTLGYEPFDSHSVDVAAYKMAIKLVIPRDQVKSTPEWINEMGNTELKEFGAMRLLQLEEFIKYPNLLKFYAALTWGELARINYTKYY